MILVDTSAWVEFFRGREPVAGTVDDLLAANEVALCGPVLTELRRGLRHAQRSRVLPLLASCRELSQPGALWEEAGELGFALARRGATVKSIDLLVAVYALYHSVPVLTTDSDFAVIQKAGARLTLAAT